MITAINHCSSVVLLYLPSKHLDMPLQNKDFEMFTDQEFCCFLNVRCFLLLVHNLI